MFVSNVGVKLEPITKDGDGFISELSADGKTIKQKFQQGVLNAPKGLAVIGKVIYVADIDRVAGFEINNGKQVFEVNFDGAILLNDLCTINDSTIAVSDTFKDRVYLLNTHSRTYVIVGHIAGPNGIAYHAASKKLYVCSLGENMNMKGKFYEKISKIKTLLLMNLPILPQAFLMGYN